MGRRVLQPVEKRPDNARSRDDFDERLRRMVAWRFAVFGGMSPEQDQITGNFDLPRDPTIEDYEEVIRRRGLWAAYEAAQIGWSRG